MALEKSVVVQGKDIEEALQRAALLLHASTTELAYEVIQPGLVDQRGVVRIPYKLRAVPVVAPPPPHEDREWLDDDLFIPPFSTEQLETMSSTDFIQHMQAAIASQPASLLEPEETHTEISSKPLELRSVGASAGSVQHNGDIIINGNVAKGVFINAAGSLFIDGDVDVAYLDANEHISISGGLLGTARSKFGSVTCRFAQGAYIESGSQITILDSVLHSNLISASLIDVGNSIVGGSCTAPHLIYAKITGSETGVITRLFSGNNSRIRDEADSVRKNASKLVMKLGEVTKVIKELEPSESTGQPASLEDRLRLWHAMSTKARINDRLVALSKRKTALIASIDQDRSARIKIFDKVHPQTIIEIDDVGMSVKKLTQFVTFSKDYEAGALRVTSFK